MKKIVIYMVFCLLPFLSKGQERVETLQSLAEQFQSSPANDYKVGVWMHWMGRNFSKEGITLDLEAMKAMDIGEAVIFNITSNHFGSDYGVLPVIENSPWPDHTYRSEAWWEAVKHTMKEAKRLGIKVGMTGTPGYATTGAPWISEEQSMQTLVFSQTQVQGNKRIEAVLPQPKLPTYKGVGATLNQTATFYRDIAVMAAPDKPDAVAAEVIDLSTCMDAAGQLKWDAPAGKWNVYRIGHAPSMTNPHPIPEDIAGKSLEVDKMSRRHNIYLWQQTLEPLKEHLQEYIGNTFPFIWIESYEAGDQNWTELFREDFIRLKGYDPLPWIALQRFADKDREDMKRFAADYKAVVSRLMIDNGWMVAKEMIHAAGLKFYWEPYWGPFDIHESSFIPDVVISEFWTRESGGIRFRDAFLKTEKRIIAAEAFTGSPDDSQFTEDPAFLKHTCDAAYVSGANKYYLHSWAHQPLDDRYQPGFSFGWWGTHFGRHQTWAKPGKAFFTYMARCQMLLQQGTFVSSEVTSHWPNGHTAEFKGKKIFSRDVLHRSTPEAEIFFIANPTGKPINRSYAFPVKNRVPELWDAYWGAIRQTNHWKTQGDSTSVDIRLEPDESVFVIFPYNQTNYAKSPEVEVVNETSVDITAGAWDVLFQPKLDQAFKRKFTALTDFSKDADKDIRYFSGTAVYEKNISISANDLAKNKRVVLDLGVLNDIAEVEINGKKAGVLWNPPYKVDITPYLKKGGNKIALYITNNWANRLIGDELYPADFEWGRSRRDLGTALKAFPDWLLNDEPRPSKDRKTFNIWYYYHKDPAHKNGEYPRGDVLLQPAGLLGPVQIRKQSIQLKTL
jgi:hypothetical protein